VDATSSADVVKENPLAHRGKWREKRRENLFSTQKMKSVEVRINPSYPFSLMATITNLPPQAYTRDTLVKAIEWLSNQAPGVRERATSADLIVSYYLQACRRSSVQMETPVSGEAFKSDLKHLAEDLKQFEDPLPPPFSGRASSHSLLGEKFRMAPPPPPVFEPELPALKPEPPYRPPESPFKPITWPVDARSLSAARELQQRLNLSNHGEALRMLVQLGAERARDLFP
jgi:hypothetical protein